MNIKEWLLSVQEYFEKKYKKKVFKRLKKKLKHKVEQDKDGSIIITLNRGE